jgi:type I restriction enzyme M protein
MLTTELHTSIEKIWGKCWPVNELKPLALLDLVSYLLFLKKIDERKLFSKLRESLLKEGHLSKNHDHEFSWAEFINMDSEARFALFKKENGIIDLVQKYSESNLHYSLYLRAPLLLMPTAGLLENALELIGLIDNEEKKMSGAIFEWLLNKSDIQAANGQVYLPDQINELIIAMMQPQKEDNIWNPAVGNGSLLTKSIEYLLSSNQLLPGDLINTRFRGNEEDLMQLRIAAMNLILHHISEPALGVVDDIEEVRSIANLPTLILANLFFNKPEFALKPEDTKERKNIEAEYLERILKSLQKTGRAAVLIREFVLQDNLSDVKKLRQQIVDYFNLEAVMFLPGNAGSLFSNACLLIFSQDEKAIAEKVWFYKMEPAIKEERKLNQRTQESKSNRLSNFSRQDEQIKEILNNWEDARKGIATDTPNSRYVSLDEIRKNDYNLSFRPYKFINNNKSASESNEAISFNKTRSHRKRRSPAVLVSLLIIAAILGFYFLFYKNHSNAETLTNQAADTTKNLDTSSSASTVNAVNTFKQKSKKTTKKSSAKRSSVSNAPAAGKERYTVKSIAYFHNEPNESTRRDAFINHWNNAVLIPKEEKNGFIYIVYTNVDGQTSKGWLNKNDLKLLP